MGTPNRCEFPSTISAPSSPGGVTSVEAEQVCRDRHRDARPFRTTDELAKLVEPPRFVRRLDDRAKHSIRQLDLPEVPDHQLDAERLGARAEHLDRLRKAAIGDEELRRADDGIDALSLHPMQHHHRLGGRRGFIQQRRRRDRHPGQVADHRLKVEQPFEAALGDLGLIRGVGRVPAGILEHVPQNDTRREAAVVAEPDIRLEQLVAGGDAPQLPQKLLLGLPVREIEALREANPRGNGFVHQRLQRRGADDLQHFSGFGFDQVRCDGTGTARGRIASIYCRFQIADFRFR